MTAANTKASEMERVAATEGTLTVTELVSKVKITSTNHLLSVSATLNSLTDASNTAPPVTATAIT